MVSGEICGLIFCDLAVFFTDKDFRLYTIYRDDNLIVQMRSAARIFWNSVQSGVAPDPIEIDDIKSLYSESSGETAIASKEAVSKSERLSEIKQQIKALKKEKDEIKSFIMLELKGAEKLIDEKGDILHTFRNQYGRNVDWEKVPEDVKKDCEITIFDKNHLKAKHKSWYDEAVEKTRVFR